MLHVYRLRALCYLGAILLLIGSCPANAQVLDYGPYSGYGLGKGILGNDYTHPLPSCIKGTASQLPASQSNVRASITYTSEEYKQAFHIDHKAEASFLGIGGGGDELHIGRDTKSSGNAFDIIVEAYGEHNSDTLNNIKWDAPYDAMMASGDPSKIRLVRETCGDRFIQTVFNQVRLFAVLHVSSQQSSSLTQFSGQVHGKVDIDIVSASAQLGGDLNISQAHQAGAIHVEIFTEGLGGLVATAGAIGIATSDGLSNIATKLAAYLSGRQEIGQPVKYQLAPFPGMPIGDLQEERIFEYLSDMKAKYTALFEELQSMHIAHRDRLAQQLGIAA